MMDRTARIIVSLCSCIWTQVSFCFRNLHVFIAFWDSIISISELTASVPSQLNPTIQSHTFPSFRKQPEQMPNSRPEHFPHERAVLAYTFASFIVKEKSGFNYVINRGPLPLLFGLIMQTSHLGSGWWAQVWIFQTLFTSTAQIHRAGSNMASWTCSLCGCTWLSACTDPRMLLHLDILHFWTWGAGPNFHLVMAGKNKRASHHHYLG